MNKTLLVGMLFILFAGCERSNPPQPTPPAPAQAQHPTAMEIAKVLKDAGIPFLDHAPGYDAIKYPMDSGPGTSGSSLKVGNDAGILSQATTATADSDIHIYVFTSREKLEEAKKRVKAMDKRTARDKALGLGEFTEYHAEQESISVDVFPDGGKPNKSVSQIADRIQKILKEKYGTP